MDTSKIRFKERVGYGLGDFASTLIFTAMTTFLTYFYTDVAGIAAATIGTVLFASRILDGLIDLGIGAVVDKTKSRHGKARPWIKWMAIPFAASAVLLFSVPEMGSTATIVYVFITYNLVNIIYSAINVPYGALTSLMTQDQHQRTLLNIFRVLFSIAGTLLVSTATIRIVEAFGGGGLGWQLTFLFYGVLGALLFYVTFYSVKERVKPVDETKNVPIKDGVQALFKNKYGGILVLTFILVTLYQTITVGSTIYYAQYVFHNKDLVGLLTIVKLVPVLIGIFLSAPLFKKFGKRNVARAGLVLAVIGSIIMLINPNSLNFIIVGAACRGLGYSAIAASAYAMFADTIEYGEWKTGLRTEGLTYSATSFGSKVGAGIGAALIGWVLAWGGYAGNQAVQSDAAITSIKTLYIYIPLALTSIQIILLSFYKLDKEFPQILRDLQERNFLNINKIKNEGASSTNINEGF
ncbi:MFS transporter [Neobacillus sp. NRS-1170]|uniref:MFS transporter n=1 Tax=Neobacillus sp. NRS-1170 TaxID=3233898 RepID=UPI003D282F16